MITWILDVILLIGALIVFTLVYNYIKTMDFDSNNINHSDPSGTILGGSNSDAINYTFLKGYGKVRICCYNAARVGDVYCLCGRAISQELRDLFNT